MIVQEEIVLEADAEWELVDTHSSSKSLVLVDGKMTIVDVKKKKKRARAAEGVSGEKKKSAGGRGGGGEDEGGAEGKKIKKQRKKKDANAPKKAKSAYLFYSEEQRALLKEDTSKTIAPTALMAELGARWKLLDVEGRKPFEERALVDKDRYKQEMDAYKLTKAALAPGKDGDGEGEEDEDGDAADDDETEEEEEGKKAKEKREATEAKKKAKAAKKRKESGDAGGRGGEGGGSDDDVSSGGSSSKAQKKEGKETSQKKRKGEEENDEEEGGVSKKKKREKKEKDKDAPKGATSAYIYYCSHSRAAVKEALPDKASKDIMAELGVRWKALSSEEKEPFELQAATDKLRFQVETKAYKEKLARSMQVDGEEEDEEREKAVPEEKEEEKSVRKTVSKTLYLLVRHSRVDDEDALDNNDLHGFASDVVEEEEEEEGGGGGGGAGGSNKPGNKEIKGVYKSLEKANEALGKLKEQKALEAAAEEEEQDLRIEKIKMHTDVKNPVRMWIGKHTNTHSYIYYTI